MESAEDGVTRIFSPPKKKEQPVAFTVRLLPEIRAKLDELVAWRNDVAREADKEAEEVSINDVLSDLVRWAHAEESETGEMREWLAKREKKGGGRK